MDFDFAPLGNHLFCKSVHSGLEIFVNNIGLGNNQQKFGLYQECFASKMNSATERVHKRFEQQSDQLEVGYKRLFVFLNNFTAANEIIPMDKSEVRIIGSPGTLEYIRSCCKACGVYADRLNSHNYQLMELLSPVSCPKQHEFSSSLEKNLHFIIFQRISHAPSKNSAKANRIAGSTCSKRKWRQSTTTYR